MLVDGEIVGEFGMKCGCEQIIFLNQRRLAGMAPKWKRRDRRFR